MSGQPDRMIAVVGPQLWVEAGESMDTLVRDIAAGGLAAKIFNEHAEDPRQVGLRDMANRGQIGGLAIVNFCPESHLYLQPDEPVRRAALHVARANLSIFTTVEESLENLGLEDFPGMEIATFGVEDGIDISVITGTVLKGVT
jgi:hypothetical protein